MAHIPGVSPAPAPEKMRLLVIEDQVMVRDLVTQLCREQFAGAQIAEAADGRTGVELCSKLRPDIVLLDLDLPDGDGLDRVAEIRQRSPGVKIVVITSHSDDYAIHRSLEANVAAFVDKCSQPIEAVGDAIAEVAAGRTFYSPAVARARARLRRDPHAFTKLLSVREQEVLRLLGEGFHNDTVAERLSVSPKTILTHRRNIMAKLGVHSTPELIRYAFKKGFTRLRQDEPAD
jgi:DNA-binding NarL/FixJ family response regulator